MTALYSINLRVRGRSNIPLLSQATILTWAERLNGPVVLAVLASFAVAAILFLSWFLKTSLGASLRATGDNEAMVRSLGIDGDGLKRLGLALSNALVALAGALVAQHQGFADIGMGVGTVVCGLASVIIGEVLFGNLSVDRALVAVTAGSIIYRLLTFGALRLGFAPTDLKLMTALLVVLAVSTTRLKRVVRLAWSS
ncbi:MAG: ABC transporter permease, partial [Bacillota bacterium]